MATTLIRDAAPDKLVYARWVLANGEAGVALESAAFADKTAHVFGTFGAGGQVELEGSNDPAVASPGGSTNWFPLVDPQGNPISKTSQAGETILENPRFIRPRVSAGDGNTSITVVIVAKKV